MYAQEGLSEAWTGVSYESRTIMIHLPWKTNLVFLIIPVMLNTIVGVAVNEMFRPFCLTFMVTFRAEAFSFPLL